uniref:Spore coat protein n=1 Tax=Panagrolaimus sp. JU765 TaxID=591449 RepID=A0AC34QGA0_9BILA
MMGPGMYGPGMMYGGYPGMYGPGMMYGGYPGMYGMGMYNPRVMYSTMQGARLGAALGTLAGVIGKK